MTDTEDDNNSNTILPFIFDESTHPRQIPKSVVHVQIQEVVTAIPNQAFCGCEQLTQVEIPETVTTIQFQAFRGCVLLVSLNLPNSLTSIGDRAFYYPVLTGIDIPDSVASIRDFAFESCQSL
mmetsp:Transcript_16714/g.21822  ORF Transcript_16714/g.21822 Transcript_16714/m.21822 type:complete len:123 (+) Transcript_16714:429-797(+)